MVGAMRVSRSLEVSTGSEGGGRVVFGSLLIEPDCVCRIDSQRCVRLLSLRALVLLLTDLPHPFRQRCRRR